MATYRIARIDSDDNLVNGADTYAPEGPLTTFFATRRACGVIDSWASRVASYRTAEITSIERLPNTVGEADPQGTYAPVSARAHNPIESAPPAAYATGSSSSRPSSTKAPAMARGNALVA